MATKSIRTVRNLKSHYALRYVQKLSAIYSISRFVVSLDTYTCAITSVTYFVSSTRIDISRDVALPSVRRSNGAAIGSPKDSRKECNFRRTCLFLSEQRRAGRRQLPARHLANTNADTCDLEEGRPSGWRVASHPLPQEWQSRNAPDRIAERRGWGTLSPSSTPTLRSREEPLGKRDCAIAGFSVRTICSSMGTGGTFESGQYRKLRHVAQHFGRMFFKSRWSFNTIETSATSTYVRQRPVAFLGMKTGRLRGWTQRRSTSKSG